jgi:hypothetical protein
MLQEHHQMPYNQVVVPQQQVQVHYPPMAHPMVNYNLKLFNHPQAN